MKCTINTIIILVITMFSVLHIVAQNGVTPLVNFQKKITAQRVDLSDSNEISEKFTAPDVYEMDTRLVATTLNSADFDSQINLTFGNQYDWELELYPVEMRSPDYKLRVMTDRGIEEHTDADVKTFYGYLKGRPDTEVRMTVKDGFLYGFVEDGESTVYFEPAERFQSNLNHGEIILYQPNQVTEAAVTCAHTEKVKKETQNSGGPSAQTRTSNGGCYELDLAIATDYSYYLDRGSNIGAVTAYTLGVMNNVATNYQLSGNTNFADGIEFLIVENFVVTTPNGNPWSTSTDPGTLLESFRTWAISDGFSASHDLGQLWSNRDFNGSTVGLAYTSPNVICSNFRYHILQDFTNSAVQLRVLTAHEIGHNFGAEHDAAGSGFIMAPSVNSTSTWSQASKTSANQAIVNASTGNNACLSTCSTGPPLSDFTASATVGCAGSTITFSDNSTNGTSNWNWSFPGGTPSSSTLQNPTVTYNNMGSYDVTLTAGNGSGTGTTETKFDFVNITQGSATACSPGGNLGSGGVSFFSLGQINNTSGTAIQDGSTYQNNTCLEVTDLIPGETYQGIMSIGNTSTNTLEAVRVYIDYNNDGDFLDVDEFVISSGNQIYAGGVSFDYTAPVNPLISGVVLRMRVMANQNLNSPCQSMTTGQAEDFGIVFPGVAPLPVTLNKYSAFPQNKFSVLNWETESEFNNDFYTLEHSIDGRNFEIIDEISGQGTTTQVSKYEYLHKTPIIGDNYYRLTQTDFDGTQEILGTRVVTFKTDEILVEIQPNPIVDEALRTAYISPEDGMVEMTVIGVDGKIIRYAEQKVTSGTTMINLNLPGLSNGVYFLRTLQGTIVKTTRFIKQ